MYPYFYLFGIEYSLYGFFTAIGIILMTVVALKLSEKANILYRDIIFGEIIALVCSFLGAHFLYIIVNTPKMLNAISYYINNGGTAKNYLAIAQAWAGGMVFYGGLIFALIGGVVYCKIRKIKSDSFSECFAPAIPLFHCFGRLGCFFSGCCYGIESKFGFTTTNAIVESCNNVNRFPVQLLEAGLNLLLFAVLLLFFYKGIFANNLIFLYLTLYSVIRFFDEFLRGDIYRGIWLGLSTSQWISVVLFIFSIVMLIKKKDKFAYKMKNMYS